MKKLKMAAAMLLCCALLAGCQKAEIDRSSPVEGAPEEIAGLCIEVTSATPTCVAYSICATEGPVYYEGHWFALIEKKEEGIWYPLKTKDFASTADFQIGEVPAEPEKHLLQVKEFYPGSLEKGEYRLAALCFASLEDLRKMENGVTVVMEFTVE